MRGVGRLLAVGLVGIMAAAPEGSAQTDTVPRDAVPDSLVGQDGLYARPFVTGTGATAIGGYVEANASWFQEAGIAEGWSMEFRRFNLFVFSSISERIRLISELEFEHGTEEIAIETALIDLRVSPAFVLRGGILLPPIGYFNMNHDSPRWDFVERPLVSTDIIPSTMSEVGFGALGRIPFRGGLLSYDVYLTNGLGDGVVSNATGRTDIPSGRREGAFEEDNNGSPALTGRIAAARPGLGELGVSFYHATYNTFRLEGEQVQPRRDVSLFALDVGGSLGPLGVRGEAAWAGVDVPDSFDDLLGDEQWGAHLDLRLPLLRGDVLDYQDAVLAVVFRVEHVDFNRGSFSSTGGTILDDVTAVTPGFTFRPTTGTVFIANYRYEWHRDLIGTPTTEVGGVQLGFATYF